VLHISVANQDLETTRWLLRRGAWLAPRATGAFFRGKVISHSAREPGRSTQLLAYLQVLHHPRRPASRASLAPPSAPRVPRLTRTTLGAPRPAPHSHCCAAARSAAERRGRSDRGEGRPGAAT